MSRTRFRSRNRETQRIAAAALVAAGFVGSTSAEPGPAEVKEPARRSADLSLFWENDGRAWNPLNSSDRHYTNGVKVVAAFHPEFADRWAGALPDLGANFQNPRSAVGVVVGQSMFTPRDDFATEVVRDDRPYAGWVYFGGFLQRADEHTMDHVEIDIGLVGPYSGAHEAQDMFHDLIGVDKFQGWDNQLETEVAFNIILERRWKLARGPIGEAFAWDLTPHGRATLGTANIDVAAGATARIGWRLPSDFGPGNIAHAVDYATPRTDSAAFFFFTRAEGKAVARNLFIEGNTFRDSHGVTAEPLIGSLTWGAVLQINRHAAFIYSQTFLAKEFKGQESHDSYGTYQLSFALDF